MRGQSKVEGKENVTGRCSGVGFWGWAPSLPPLVCVPALLVLHKLMAWDAG